GCRPAEGDRPWRPGLPADHRCPGSQYLEVGSQHREGSRVTCRRIERLQRAASATSGDYARRARHAAWSQRQGRGGCLTRGSTRTDAVAVDNIQLNPYQVIVRPLVTEKGTTLSERHNAYTFEVHPKADKTDIRRAVEELWNVRVNKVR